MSPVFDLAGNRQPDTIAIVLMPGQGIQVDGAHLDSENGPHDVPAEIAIPLLHARRARLASEVPEPEPEPPAKKK